MRRRKNGKDSEKGKERLKEREREYAREIGEREKKVYVKKKKLERQ
jgi:hypothetical protein